MSYVATKSKFHLALDGVGLILQGAPDRLAYEMKQAPIYGNRFAQGDRSYADFSFWWFWTQTDWSGGLKEDPNWADDAKFSQSKNLDALTIPGQLKLLDLPVVNTTDISTNSLNITRVVYGTVDDGVGSLSAFFLGNRASTVDGSNGCRLWYSTDGDTWTLVNHFVNVNNVEDLFFSLQTLYIVMNSELYVFNDSQSPFTTVTERTTEFNATGDSCASLRCGVDVNGVAHVFGDILGFGNVRLKTSVDDGATFTQKKSLPIGVQVYNAISFNSDCYYLREVGGGTELYRYNFANNTDTYVYRFDGLTPVRSGAGFGTNISMTIVNNTLCIQFNNGSIWSCTTDDVITQEFENRNSTLPVTGGLMNHKGIGYGMNVAINRQSGETAIFNNRRNATDAAALIPAASNGSVLLYINQNSDANDNKVYRSTTGSYYASGNFITNEFANVSAIDKLYYDVTCNFAPLASGESIQVEYSIDGGATYTSLGTASFSVDGAITNKNFLFGDAVVSKTLVLRVTLAGGGTTTPTFKDYSTRYYPFVTTKKLWSINANCGDEVRRLDGGLVETVGRELKGRLERAWWTKSILDFQDLDYATTLLNGSISSSATTITVDDTADFPEQGRLRVDNEEMTYTGKTPTTFTGVTRAARETKAASHSDNAVINNAYKVILTDLQTRVPVALEDKELEYTMAMSLREV